MKENNGIWKGLTFLFMALTILLGCYSIYNSSLPKDENVVTNDNIKASNDSNTENNLNYLEGLYGGKYGEVIHNIYFYKNGTFSYVSGDEVLAIKIGNYVRNGNVITLNYWLQSFEQYSSEQKIMLNETSTIIINEDNSLSLNVNNNTTNIVLKEIIGEEKEKLIKSKAYDVTYIRNLIIENLKSIIDE